MSHFYGTLQGTRGEATRCGTKTSRMETYCASWDGAIRCYAYVKKTCKNCKRSERGHKVYKGEEQEWVTNKCDNYQEREEDWVRVEKVLWHGAGEQKLLYEGPMGEEK